MQSKKDFVKQYLKPLILALDNDIKDVYYTQLHDSEEFVVIVRKSSNCPTNQCVTADSLPALVRDVMSAL